MKKKIYFLCSPSLGILDNWLPVIHSLRQERPKDEFVFLLSKAGNIDHLDLDNILIKMAQEVFDTVIAISPSGKWLKTPSFKELKKNSSRHSFEQLLNKIYLKTYRRKFLAPISFLIKNVLTLVESLRLNHLYFDLNQEIDSPKNSVLLYDVYEQQKEYNQELVSLFKNTPAFSFNHGIDISQDKIVNRYHSKDKIKNIKAFLYSPNETNYYKESFGLDNSNLFISGVPRHQESWMQLINSYNQTPLPWENYVFLISRSLSSYFPFERKKQAIEDIKKVIIDEMKLKLVIKKHPKEPDDGLFEEILGKESYGQTWLVSNLHPFILGNTAQFALSFYSGVCVDMLALGKSTIEYLDLRNLKGYDEDDSIRDKDGIPCLSYRYLGLVLGASDENSLREKVQSILTKPQENLSSSIKVFNSLFEREKNAIEFIKGHIIDALEEKNS